MPSEIDAIRALLSSKPRPVGWAERRARLDEVGTVYPASPDIALESVALGGVPCEWSLAPGSDAGKVLVFFHGGGFCSGSIASHRALVTEAGRAAGIRTLAVGYRLAPEHPFPAAFEDALAVWSALRSAGYAPGSIAVGGDSAGGAITLSLATRLLARGEAPPAALWLLSPWTDLTMSGASMDSKAADDPLIHRVYLEELRDALLPRGVDPRSPDVSMLFAEPRGLPPSLVQVGSAETLLDDSVRWAERAGAAEVRVTLEIWPRMIHAFPLWNKGLAEGRAAIASAARFMRAGLGLPAS